MKPVAHLSEANLEMTAAGLWHDQRKPGLGERFFAAIEATQLLVQEAPELGTPHHRGTRRRRVTGFPYHLVYLEETDRILVVAVAHAKRDEHYWEHRLD
jgi:toxin ParE1/3/4